MSAPSPRLLAPPFSRALRAHRSGLLQLQAIVDQHTNQLSVTQASLESVESAAPAQDRLRYVHALGYPPRWAMQRMLADKYRKFGALRSAQEVRPPPFPLQ